MSDSNTMLVRAKSALLARDYTLAEKIYKNLILEEPDNISYKMQLGNLYVKAGKDDQALTIFKQIEKADNENLDALVAISGIYRRQKRYEESVAFLEQGLIICESSPKAHAKISYNLGFTYRQMGNYDGAIKCFEEVVEDNPSDVLANNHLGAIYALQGNHTQAIEAYNRGLKYDPNHPILQFNIAKSYAEIGEISKAQSFYEGALRAKPGWTEAIEAYSDLLLVENKVAEADTVVNQALELYPDDVKMHTAKGNVFNRQSIFEHAEAEFKKALDVDETYKNALTGLAHSLENQGKLGEAIEVINKAEKMNPKDLKIKKQSAQIHISANELDTAFEKISKLREIDGNDVQTLNLLGQYYICKDDAAKAEECFANIKKINPDYNEIYRDWGKRFIQKGDEKKAEPYLHAAIQKNPSDSDAMVCLGELYEKQNQIGKALQFYKKASA
ncbi:MAG: tetratricopeptide repeat protein, partial [Treponema sp.]|nr:tetratricopeptide repeat protein [Treponema sp.]